MAKANLSAAIDAVKQWAERNRAISDLADALEGLGSIENATSEALAARAEASDELAKTKTLLAAAKADVDAIVAKGNDLREAAEAEAAGIVPAAKKAADELLAAARAKADDMIDSAKRDAAAAVSAKKEELEAVTASVAAGRGVLGEIEHDIANAKQVLAATQAGIDDLRKSAQNILGVGDPPAIPAEGN